MNEGIVISPLCRSIDVRKMSEREMKNSKKQLNANDRHIDRLSL